MLNGLLLLLIFQLIGEALFRVLPFKVPGPVWGLMLLTVFLVLYPKPVSKEVEAPSRVLIRYFGLLFVPAGVGIIQHLDVLQANWLPIFAGLIGSTILCLWVTSVLMQFFCKQKIEGDGI